MTTTAAVVSAVAALLVILGAAWKFVRGITKNADAWDTVKHQLLPNAGSSLVDRVKKIEEHQQSTDTQLAAQRDQLASINDKLAAIHNQVTP